MGGGDAERGRDGGTLKSQKQYTGEAGKRIKFRLSHIVEFGSKS